MTAPVRAWLLLLSIGVLACLPLALWAFPGLGFDTRYHIAWHVHFAQQVWEGDLYPRWLIGMNAGLGSPVFFYYPPLAHWVAALLHPLGDPEGWYQLAAAAGLLLVASGVACHLWLRSFLPPLPAAAGAIVYMLQPAHYAIDLFTRTAFAEFAAFVWLPLILLAVRRLTEGGGSAAFVGLALAQGLLLFTHLPTTLLFAPIVPVYALLLARERRVPVLVGVLLAQMLGAALAAIYLVPAMTTQDLASFQFLWEIPFFDWSRWFLFSPDVPQFMSRFLLVVSVIALTYLVFVLCAAPAALAVVDRRREVVFWLVVGLVALFFMTGLSRPLWTHLPLIDRVQAPWRFVVVLALPASVLCAAMLTPAPRGRIARLGRIAAVAVMLSWLLPTGHAIHVRSNIAALWVSDDPGLYQYLDQPEYYPPSARDWLVPFQRNPIYREGPGLDRQRLLPVPPRAEVIAGEAVVRTTTWQPRRLGLEVEAGRSSQVVLGQLYYEGWTARRAGDGARLALRPSPERGLLALSLPEGSYTVELRLESPTETQGALISLIALAVLALTPLLARLRRSRRQAG